MRKIKAKSLAVLRRDIYFSKIKSNIRRISALLNMQIKDRSIVLVTMIDTG